MDNTRIYLVRHAESMGNLAKIFQGRIDEKLSENGVNQLKSLKSFFSDIHLDAVYSSPLLRTRETAKAIGEEKSLSVNLLPDVIEINGGQFEGLGWDEIIERFPDEMRLWEKDIGSFAAPNGESALEVYNRVVNAISEVAERNKGKTISIVSHGFAIRCYMCFASGFTLDRLKEINWLGNTEHSLITISPNSGKVISMEASHNKSFLENLPSI